jgi:hypothetical protein
MVGRGTFRTGLGVCGEDGWGGVYGCGRKGCYKWGAEEALRGWDGCGDLLVGTSAMMSEAGVTEVQEVSNLNTKEVGG